MNNQTVTTIIYDNLIENNQHLARQFRRVAEYSSTAYVARTIENTIRQQATVHCGEIDELFGAVMDASLDTVNWHWLAKQFKP